MPSSSESDPNLNFTCDDDLNRNHEIQDTSTTDNYVMNSQASNGHLDETNGLGNASISLADLDLSSDTLNEDPGTEASRSRDSPYRNDSNESLPAILPPNQKPYDYLLKVLLVGDSDVGKQEILAGLEDGTTDSPFCSTSGAAYRTTTILIDGKRVKLQLWDTSGQGRFCTIIRSYSRGAQGILLVYDITNKWSFEGIDRWLKEVDQHAPGIPKVLVGNRLHLAFKRQVDQAEAETYAEKNAMGFFEVSPLVNFNISETFVELARMALKRNGMERLWRSNKGKFILDTFFFGKLTAAPDAFPAVSKTTTAAASNFPTAILIYSIIYISVSSLYEMCAHTIVKQTTVYGIERLPLPPGVKENLKSYALTNYSTLLRHPGGAPQYKSLKKRHKFRAKTLQTPADAAKTDCASVGRRSCVIS